MRLQGKVVIVTGAARGLGRVYARAVAGEGGKVVVSDVLDGEEAAEEIRKSGGDAVYVRADVSDEKDVEALAGAAHGRYGQIDGLVNNAALLTNIAYGTFDEISAEEWDAVMAVNVKGAWLAARAVYPYMEERGEGRIVNISSGVPFKGTPIPAHYTVSKGAIITLTRVLARSMGKDGICVNAVGPGLTRSDSLAEARGDLYEEGEAAQIPTRAIPRGQVPEDLIGAIVFFLSGDAAFITGQTLLVDGGSYMN